MTLPKYLLLLLIVAGIITIIHLAIVGNRFTSSPSSSSSELLSTSTKLKKNSKKRSADDTHNNNDDRKVEQNEHQEHDDDDAVTRQRHSKRQQDGDFKSPSSSSPSLSCKSLPLHKNATVDGIGVKTVQLCWTKSGCGGFIKITVAGKEECTTPVLNPSSSLSSNSNLKNNILARGPHQFRIRLEGREVFSVPSSQHRFVFAASAESTSHHHQKVCNYFINLPRSLFRLAGRYRIGLEMLFRNYAHLDEARDVWPELLKVPLLPIDEKFFATTKYHLQQCTLPARKDIHLDCKFAKDDFHDQEDDHIETDQKFTCDGKKEFDLVDGTGGSWKRLYGLKTHAFTAHDDDGTAITNNDDDDNNNEDNNINHFFTRVRVRKIRKEPILFEWALQKEKEALWWPRNCKVAPMLSRKEIFARFGGKRIVVSGDSQLRALYYALVNTINGNSEQCVRNITTLASEPRECISNVKGSQRKSLTFSSSSSSGVVGSSSSKPIQVDYIDDLFLNRIKQKLGYNYDIIICGFGQHPASKEHWRFDKYAKAVDQRMNQLKTIVDDEKKKQKKDSDKDEDDDQRQQSRQKVIWYAAPHYPHTRKGYPVVVKDWRTDLRLELFNNYSTKVARANGFAVLDSFAISDAFMHTSPDQAHFSNFVASEFVRMLFSILGHLITPQI